MNTLTLSQTLTQVKNANNNSTSLRAKARKIWLALPWVKPVTVFFDNIESNYNHLKKHDLVLAQEYLRNPNAVYNAISDSSKTPLKIYRYGNKQRLVNCGYPKSHPICNLQYLNSKGKTAADMSIAIGCLKLPLSVKKVVIAESDSNMKMVLSHLRSQGISATSISFNTLK